MKKKVFIMLAAIVALTLDIAPAFSQVSKWRPQSPSKMIFLPIGDTLNIEDVQATNIFFLTGELKDSGAVDSLIFNVKSVGKKPFAAQVRVTSDSSKIMGQVLKVVSLSTELERVALAIKDFKVKTFNTIRFYMNVGDKSGWQISGVELKEKYVAPPVVIEAEPTKNNCTCVRDSIVFEAPAGYEFIYIKGLNSTDTLRQKPIKKTTQAMIFNKDGFMSIGATDSSLYFLKNDEGRYFPINRSATNLAKKLTAQ